MGGDRRDDHRDDRSERVDDRKHLVQGSGDAVMVVTEGGRLLRRSASSLPASLTLGVPDRPSPGSDRARKSALTLGTPDRPSPGSDRARKIALILGPPDRPSPGSDRARKSTLTLGAPDRPSPGRDRARNSAKILKVSQDYLDAKRRSRIRQTFPFKAHAAARDAGKSKAESGRQVAAPSVSAAVSAAELATSSRAVAAAGGGVDSEGGSRRYGNSVTGLASVLRRPDGRTHPRRRHERDSEKSRKYVAGSSSSSVSRPRHGPALADVHGRPLWRPVTQAPLPDPVKPSMAGGSCCASMRKASCASLLLLPIHLFLLVVFLWFLIIGGFILSKVEGDGPNNPAVVVRLPGTPKDPDMAAARQELVERLLNTSLDVVLDRSQEVVIAAIFTSPRMQNALRAFQQVGGIHLPSDGQMDRLSRSVMTEWQQHLHDLTARYHALVARHAHGFKVREGERREVWASEEPPSPLPWTFWPALLHVFCLVSTTGSSVRPSTPAGRALAIVYSVVGIVLYIGIVALWAARLGATFSLIIKIFSRKKVDPSGGNMRASPYHSMEGHAQPVHQHTSARLILLAIIILIYVLSVGVHVVGGCDYWSGVENAIFILLTVRPPTPLPEGATRVTAFIAFVMVGHILLTLFIYVLKVVCVRWMNLWGRTS